MDFKEMVKRTKDDLKNFNSTIGILREYKIELANFQGYEEIFPKDIKDLKLNINRINLNLEIIRNSLSILEPREQQIITDYYFSNTIIKNIAMKFNLSQESISKIKDKAIKELAKCMYGHLEGFEFEETCRYVPGITKGKSKPVYQYDMEKNFVKRWDLAKDCGQNGFNASCVRDCCNGKNKQHKGYVWSYKPIPINQ